MRIILALATVAVALAGCAQGNHPVPGASIHWDCPPGQLCPACLAEQGCAMEGNRLILSHLHHFPASRQLQVVVAKDLVLRDTVLVNQSLDLIAADCPCRFVVQNVTWTGQAERALQMGGAILPPPTSFEVSLANVTIRGAKMALLVNVTSSLEATALSISDCETGFALWQNGRVAIHDSQIRSCSVSGLRAESADQLVLDGLRFSENTLGLDVVGDGTAQVLEISNSTFEGNWVGAQIAFVTARASGLTVLNNGQESPRAPGSGTGGGLALVLASATIHESSFSNPGSLGILQLGGTADASRNWWSHAAGPTPCARVDACVPVLGDLVTPPVTYVPFLTRPL